MKWRRVLKSVPKNFVFQSCNYFKFNLGADSALQLGPNRAILGGFLIILEFKEYYFQKI